MEPLLKAILEMDGMDQQKTYLPRLLVVPKSLDKCEVMKNHLVGVLVNGKQYSVIHHQDHWLRDPNLTLSIFVQALKKLPKPWPPVLYVQLDNCTSENKNAVVFFFMALLVHRNVFKEVSFFLLLLASNFCSSYLFYNIIETIFYS
jgi:hypothetical protein